ncbi:MAG: response regulator transcription factor [Ilyomonas sp.]
MMKKIVIVEDDQGILDVLQMIFKRAGYETCVFSNAAPILEGRYNPPDVFLLDKQLSGSNGLDVCRYLKSKKETQHIPVIMISASPEISTLYKEACADDYIEKPFRSKELLAVVERWSTFKRA